jgi:antitoxin (DNA-binding transcriptional repressor) of toxin-antitoxin stability system
MVGPIKKMQKKIEPTIIRAGEPIVQVIPIKREDIVARTCDYNSGIQKRLQGLASLWNITFAAWGKYMRTKKSYTVDARDIDLPFE